MTPLAQINPLISFTSILSKSRLLLVLWLLLLLLVVVEVAQAGAVAGVVVVVEVACFEDGSLPVVGLSVDI